MIKMLFTLPQDKVRIVPLPNGMYDVTVLDKEEQVEIPPAEEGEIAVTMYQYDGNQFRTVYELTEEEILDDLEKYLNYETSGEPTPEQLAHDNKLIDSYTLELMEEGIL